MRLTPNRTPIRCTSTWVKRPPTTELRSIAYQLDGAEAENGAGSYLLFVIHNSDWSEREFQIPEPGADRRWYRVADTSMPAGEDFAIEGREQLLLPPDRYRVQPRSSVLLLAR